MMACAREFVGEHDFKLFCKPDGKVTTRRLGSIELKRDGDLIIIDVRGREFLRNMVRRIVSAIDQVGNGGATIADVRGALRGEGRSLGIADPEGLFLMDVEHEVKWELPPSGPMVDDVLEEAYRAQVRHRFSTALLERVRTIDAPDDVI